MGIDLPDDDFRAVLAVAFALHKVDQHSGNAFPRALAHYRSADAALPDIACQEHATEAKEEKAVFYHQMKCT